MNMGLFFWVWRNVFGMVMGRGQMDKNSSNVSGVNIDVIEPLVSSPIRQEAGLSGRSGHKFVERLWLVVCQFVK